MATYQVTVTSAPESLIKVYPVDSSEIYGFGQVSAAQAFTFTAPDNSPVIVSSNYNGENKVELVIPVEVV